MGVALVDGVVLAEDGLPVAVVGEGKEGVGVEGGVVDEGEIELLRQGKGLTVEAGTADDKNLFLFRFTSGEGGGEGGEYLCTGENEGDIAAKDDISAVR